MTRLQRFLPHALGGVALLCELAAIYCVTRSDELTWPLIGLGVHVAGAIIARIAAGRRRPDLSKVEGDVVLFVGLLVPFFGPTMAGLLPRPPGTDEEANAHAVFEHYSEHVKPDLPDYERTLFTGDYEKDLARELDAESYHEVLRHGSTDQKRNALRRLAELGEPAHFQLIRQCLLDPSHEVRLYAYSELERSSRPYEEGIATHSRAVEKKPGDTEAYVELAHTYFAYAASGIQDEQMAAFYFRSAENFAMQAVTGGHTEPDPAWIRAAALAKLGEFDEASAVLEALPPDQHAHPRSCVIRAELAFRRRDFAAAREEAERMKAEDRPRWLAALVEVKK